MAIQVNRAVEAGEEIQAAPVASEVPNLPEDASEPLKEWHRRLKKNQLDRVANRGQSPGVRKITLAQG